ncbi:helix-turn-helix domain-containing protein [Mucilaginibacter roseus]|uniref:Helix-turn-helix domain-containing protein n=1 Tax=Mucilaginibacter roseus TaxID=1528868 RepID=A0ABS8TZW8_9SPHI|nr:helix-turn-helix domain-containing protein [Mucilaginibacter roseus]MCD8739355.1 helix-turn-helix domain-containing protein [Mucilaginibacter roseus]
MNYVTIAPPAHLRSFVRYFWALEYTLAPGEQNYVYRSIADGCSEIVFHVKGLFDDLLDTSVQKGWRSGMHFQSFRYTRFITSEDFVVFGAYLYPYAVPMLFNFSAQEGSNLSVELDGFLSASDAKRLEEQIVLADNHAKRAEILSHYLSARLNTVQRKDENILASIQQVIHSNQLHTVSSLANQANLSMRQFDRKFKHYAGFSPKFYSKIARLHDALERYSSHQTLTQIALDCGYYDQSHFIHDVKAFTGYHPKAYFSGKAEGTQFREW